MGVQGIYGGMQTDSLRQAMRKAQEEKEARQKEAKAAGGTSPEAARRDEYIPGDAAKPAAKPIEEAADPAAAPEAAPEEPKKAAGGRPEEPEECTANTDKVEREIRKLKQKKEQLKEQLRACEDETEKEKLEQKLQQVEAELREKDNEGYRRRHTEFS